MKKEKVRAQIDLCSQIVYVVGGSCDELYFYFKASLVAVKFRISPISVLRYLEYKSRFTVTVGLLSLTGI